MAARGAWCHQSFQKTEKMRSSPCERPVRQGSGAGSCRRHAWTYAHLRASLELERDLGIGVETHRPRKPRVPGSQQQNRGGGMPSPDRAPAWHSRTRGQHEDRKGGEAESTRRPHGTSRHLGDLRKGLVDDRSDGARACSKQRCTRLANTGTRWRRPSAGTSWERTWTGFNRATRADGS